MLLRFRFASLILATLAAVSPGEAQRPVPRAEAVSPSPAPGTGAGGTFSGNSNYSAVERAERSFTPVDPNKRLNVGDAVSVQILEDQEEPMPRQVSPTGEIDVAGICRVRVTGKTTSEAEAAIKQKLEADYYHVASVRVSIERVNPTAALRKVHITGEVRAPGAIEWPVSEELYLTEAINRAGGFTDWANKKGVVLFRKKDGTQTTHNIRDIQNAGGKGDPLLEEGDRVLIKKILFKITD
jgi:protein involved in polysaccharide export with SLBB domain